MKIKPIVEKQPASNVQVSENALLDRIYRNRGVTSPAELEKDLSKLLHPMTMKGMDKASNILMKHILAGSSITIVGDYDCDGATSTSIAVEGLQLLGAKNVRFLVPDRMKHGYGLSPAVVEIAGADKPDVIVTVDNGIASFEGAEAVRNLAHPCELVITDHHLAPERGIPEADAIVNPNQPGCSFKSKAIAGCGVMFYVILAVRMTMREANAFQQLGMNEPKIEQLLDLVALGTVADVVPLDQNNRILVSAGLKRINSGLARPGIKALLEIGKRRIGDIVTTDMGFAVGPRLNAAGRLDDMSIGIRCLLEKDARIATAIAQELDDFNKQRKEMEAEMVQEAVSSWDNLETEAWGVCLHAPDWHEGVVGIVASRIKEKLNRPVICFSDTEKAREVRCELESALARGEPQEVISRLKNKLGEEDVKGSARSVPGVHLKHLLDEINKKNPEALSKFGGHAMAAGMSIKIKHFEYFKSVFDGLVRKHLTQKDIDGQLEVDIKDLPANQITIENAELIRTIQPWGQMFQQPVFSARFDIRDIRPIQDKHLKLQLSVCGDAEKKIFDAIIFNVIEDGVIPVRDQVEAVFTLDVNEWRGKRSLQLMLQHIQDESLVLQMEKKSEERGSVKLDGVSKRKSVSLEQSIF